MQEINNKPEDYLAKTKEQLLQVQERYAFAIGQTNTHSKMLEQHRYDIKQIEVKVGGEVAGEKTGDGKPLFPNETMRAAELNKRLMNDEKYKVLINSIDLCESIINDMKVIISISHFTKDVWDILERK